MATELNKIEFQASVIAELYTSVLVDIPASSMVAKPEQYAAKPAGKWLGDNHKNILILVNEPSEDFLADAPLALLKNLLNACKLELSDIALINLNNYGTSNYKELLSFFRSHIILLFGPGPGDIDLPVLFPHFQVQAHAKAQFLSAPPLAEIENNQLLKSKLWVCLRRIFGV